MATVAVEARKHVRTAVTRIHSDVDAFGTYETVDLNKINAKLHKLELQLDQMNEKVQNLKFPPDKEPDATTLEAELNSCDLYFERICDAQSAISNLLAARTSATASAAPGANTTGIGSAQQLHAPSSLLKSPVAPLPKFESKEGENLELFIGMFDDAVSKFHFTEYDKIVLLKQQVSGRAALLIKDLPPEKHKYGDIIEILKRALASVDVQKFNTIKQLSDLKLPFNGEPFQYYCDVQKLLQSFKALKISIDDILTYFIYCGLNDSFRNQLTLVTNSTHPTLEDITANFFKANERYELAKKVRSRGYRPETDVNMETNTYALVPHASRIENPLTKCTLCVEPNNNHGLHRCNSYPLPSDKLKRLKDLKACTMCGKTSHLFDKCDFIFRSDCDYCHKKHFRFLCPFRSNARPAVSHNNGDRLDSSKNLYRRGSDKKVTGVNCIEVKGVQEAESVETKCHIVCAIFFFKKM